MATGKRGAGPGAYTQNGVNGTMKAPFSKATSSRTGTGGGEYGSNHAPFGKPQDVGNGGIPTKFYDGMSAKSAQTVTAGNVSAKMTGQPNVGTRRFKK